METDTAQVYELRLIDTAKISRLNVAIVLAMFIPELEGLVTKVIKEVEQFGEAPAFVGTLEECQEIEAEFKERQVPCKICLI